MAVFDPSWWAVLWPWMLVWGGTIVSMLVTVVITVTHRRRHRRNAKKDRDQSGHLIAFYLDNEKVMDLYQQYQAPLSKKVKATIGGSVNLPFGGIELSKEEVIDFITKYEPITVVRIVIDVLDEADDIVYINLGEQEITRNDALAKILRKARNGFPNAVPLRDMRGYVSALGRFLPVKQDDPAEQDTSTAALTAFCGDSTDAGDHIYVTYKVSRLRGDPFPANGSLARCLGRVNEWDSTQQRLNIDPIAIFLC